MSNDADGFVVEGFLVGGDAHSIELVMPPYLLVIDRADVRGFDERPALPAQNATACVAVRLELRDGARLRDMRSARELESAMWYTRRPFAMATRPIEAPVTGEAAYAARERSFLATFGLGEPS